MKNKSILLALLPFIALLLLILLFLNKLAFTNLILARGDTFLYFYPYWHAAADALRTWRIPLWNPAIFMGAPLLANSQMGFFYPFNWPAWLLLATPYAVSASILLHLLIAGIGAYLAGRRVMRLDRLAAFVTALVFALGGYLAAQAEHINQLQGLAWLPWMLFAVAGVRVKNRRQWLLSALAVAFLFSLQLLAGHTQTAFITGVALVIWILTQQLAARLASKQENLTDKQIPRSTLLDLSLLGAGGLFALLLTAVQLLPTLELTSLSNRQGGLPSNEVLSFSLNPLLLTRALLPAYGQSLFSEYVAYFPLLVLALAFIGAWQWRKKAGVLPAIIWIITALLLALGAYNPFNWLLAQLPGFNLFRVPARWLVLYALGVALLTGVGWQIIADHIQSARRKDDGENGKARLRKDIFQPLLLFLLLFSLLAIWSYLAGWLVDIIPAGLEAPYEAPSLLTYFGWGVELLLLALLCLILYRWNVKNNMRLLLVFLLGFMILALFLSTRTMPYNNLTTPEAFFDMRSSMTRLLVDTADPPGRLLSLSDIFFDPGDQAEIDSIYVDQLSQSAQYDYTIAVKQKEVVSPNLPMVVGLASVDGFDGGVLPLQSYGEQMKLLLAGGIAASDGRLREHLKTVPEARWLDLFNTKFLITDKVGDIWRDGIFFDRQHPLQLERGEEAPVGYLPDFEATELRLLASHNPGPVQIITSEEEAWTIEPIPLEQDLYQVPFPAPAVARKISVAACPAVETCELLALTLVDDRDGAFQALVPGDYRMIHSGDVKIYENLDVMPRAYMISEWQWEQDSAAALAALKSPDFDPRRMAILTSRGDNSPLPEQTEAASELAAVEIRQYLPERVIVATDEEQDAVLILTDANYPGWQAAIDGQPAPIYQANRLFRAVYVPAGVHEIVFSFEPRSFDFGLLISLASLVIASIILTGLLLSRRNQSA